MAKHVTESMLRTFTTRPWIWHENFVLHFRQTDRGRQRIGALYSFAIYFRFDNSRASSTSSFDESCCVNALRRMEMLKSDLFVRVNTWITLSIYYLLLREIFLCIHISHTASYCKSNFHRLQKSWTCFFFFCSWFPTLIIPLSCSHSRANFLFCRLLRTTAHIFIRDLELCSKVVFLYIFMYKFFSALCSCCAMALFLPLGSPDAKRQRWKERGE